jgi:hypothetical protein
MIAEELLRQVRARGATFQVLEESRLKVRASSPLPDGMMEELRQHKIAILALLADEPPETALAEVDQGETAKLLAWAAHAAETGVTLLKPVHFLETPLRPYTTAEVGRYCRDQLRCLAMARSNKVTGGWGRFTPEWWSEMEAQSIQALTALKATIEETDIRVDE